MACSSEQLICDTIKSCFNTHSYVLCPHSACGFFAVQELCETMKWKSVPKHEVVVLGTAHPAKFGDNVSKATGTDTVLPKGLAACVGAETRLIKVPKSTHRVQQVIEENVGLDPSKERC